MATDCGRVNGVKKGRKGRMRRADECARPDTPARVVECRSGRSREVRPWMTSAVPGGNRPASSKGAVGWQRSSGGPVRPGRTVPEVGGGAAVVDAAYFGANPGIAYEHADDPLAQGERRYKGVADGLQYTRTCDVYSCHG